MIFCLLCQTQTIGTAGGLLFPNLITPLIIWPYFEALKIHIQHIV